MLSQVYSEGSEFRFPLEKGGRFTCHFLVDEALAFNSYYDDNKFGEGIAFAELFIRRKAILEC